MKRNSLAGKAHQPLPQCFGPKMGHFLDYTFPQLFEEQVAIGPDRLAVVAGSERLTYGELNAHANQLAHHLRALGAGRETLVGICIDRSLDMAVGILAILKSGAGYLPIDPDYPAERLKWMLADSGVALVVTQEKLATKLSGCDARLVALDTDRALIAQQPKANLHNGPNPDNLAYVIYTSGSTGEPKGVMITHSSLANYVLALHHELQIDHHDRYLHTASISFSSSRRQLLLPLSQGAAVVIASAAQRKDPLALFEMIKVEGVTVMDAVPSFWRSCTAILETLQSDRRAHLLDNRLRLMLSASEPLLSDIPQTWMSNFDHKARHVHMFGQTETAGIVCLHEIRATGNTGTGDDIGVVPVGRPIANTEIYILNEQQQPVAMGTPGELYIGGAGLGRGYLARPELTAAKFVPHPFTEIAGARLYRTGDWARWRPDGAVEFAGRQDSQVKLRGFRVELQEIETVLAGHAAIKDSVVVANDDGSAKRLIAYFVTNSETCSVTELRNFLSERLPDYMVPSAFVQLSTLPLNVNGKVNRRALPKPGKMRPQITSPYLAPQTTTEKLLATIWSGVLRVDQTGIDDDFFELGGHSLLAMQVIARINERMQVTLPLRELFDGPTIRHLAQKIDSIAIRDDCSAQMIPIIPRTLATPLSFAQQRLWFLDQLEPGSPLYNINRALRLHGPLDLTKLERAFQSVATRHEPLRTTFVEIDGLLVQRIASTSPSQVTLPFSVHDLRSVSKAIREQEVQRILTIDSAKSFDLARGPLARATVLRVADDEYVLLLSIHHIIADAWSISLFFQELASFYLNEESQLPLLRVQYADFAEWQRKRFDSGALSAQLAYWKQQLADAPLALDLPTDRTRPAYLSSGGAKETLSLGEELRQSLKDVSREQGVTFFMLLTAAFQVLLARYSEQDDILIGTPVAGRTLVDTEALIGCFINTLVLRADLSGNPSLREVIKRTRERALGAFTHQDVPFEKLVEELRPNRSLGRNPIFQVMFVVQDETKPELTLPGLRVTSIETDTATAKFELALGVVEKVEGMDVWLSYSKDLFEASSIAAMLADFKSILESVVRDGELKVSDLPALSWTPQIRREEKIVNHASEPAHKEFVAPRTPVEERLSGIWSEVLRVETVSVHDNFFELGGHSLLAAQVIARARNVFSAELTLRRLFETPTIAGLAEAIYEIQTSETEDDELAAMLAELCQLSEEEAQQRVANG